MPSVFGIFQIGPVQEFIVCAKKTQDFWSGSYLLSYLTCVAMYEVVKQSQGDQTVVIYPDLTQQPLYEYVTGLAQDGKNPWQQPPTVVQLRPTVPNRFVARLEEGTAKTALNAAAQQVAVGFRKIANHIRDELWKKIQDHGMDQTQWTEIWHRQTEKDLFEVYWVISPLDDQDQKYGPSYREAEAVFGARKAVRNFDQPKSEPGYKCTLCGQREPLHAQANGSENRGNLIEFWNEVREKTGHRFREGEHLCAICTTRRLAPDWGFRRERDLPSTSSMAVADFLATFVEVYQADPSPFVVNGHNLVHKFADSAREVARASNQNARVEPLPRIASRSQGISGLDEVLTLDGDWFLQETYDVLREREPKPGRPAVDPGLLEAGLTALSGKNPPGLISATREACKALKREWHNPHKYYAVFMMDGDEMGGKITACNSDTEHRKLSELLAEFSGKTAPGVIERDHLGKVIYFGGDEGVGFVSLDHLLPSMDACRHAFESLQFGNAPLTACIGAVIAHHQQALLSVLGEARAALKWAKELDHKRAFCLSIMKRSGGTVRARARWTYDALEVIPVLTGLVGYYQADRLSDRWWRQLAEEAWGFRRIERGGGDATVIIDLELVFPEIERLVTRHVSRGSPIPAAELASLIRSLQDLLRELSPDWETFMGLMEATTYIARGGGR